MNYRYQGLLVLITIAFILNLTIKVKAQQIWSFDQKEVLKTNDGLLTLDLHSIRNIPELTDGIIGKGLRTDGYATWLNSNIKTSTIDFGISGWFALESFPTDTAAFFALKDSIKKTSISICVDRFGELLIGKGVGNTFLYYSTKHYVERFKWINLAFARDGNTIDVIVNGEVIHLDTHFFPEFSCVNEIKVAKDFREKKIGIHSLTGINGIVDELKLWNGNIDLKELKQEVGRLSSKLPVLAVPESRFDTDFSRPKYHLLPAANWTNETHGLIYFKDKYHIFNQKNASNLLLRQINWGHFSSLDLINWTEHKPALSPESGYDENGIWSGHVVLNDQGIPTAIYTAGGERMGVGIAFPTDSNLINWTKYNENPVVLGQPDSYSRVDLRDPYVWKEGGKWYMIIGFGIEKEEEKRGALLLYTSPNLKKWSFIHTLYEGNPEIDDSGIFWEMPVFKKIGEKYILLINKVPYNRVPARAMYWIGDFQNEKFIPDNPIPKNLEVVNRLLSPSVAIDEQGLTTTIAIIPDEIGTEASYKQGWAHVYSIPRIWDLQDDKIIQTPHPALKELRGKHTAISNTSINSGTSLKINENHHQLEVKITILPNDSRKFGFIINKNSDNSEYTKLYYDVEKNEIVIDQSRSTLKDHIPLEIRKGAYNLDTSKPVDFHLFIDGSVVEVFINNEDALTTRIFPLKESSNQLEVFTEGGKIQVHGDVWLLKSAKMETDF